MWHAIMLDRQVYGIKRAEELSYYWSAVLLFAEQDPFRAVAEIGLYRITNQEALNNLLSLVEWCVRQYEIQSNMVGQIVLEVVYTGETEKGVCLNLSHNASENYRVECL